MWDWQQILFFVSKLALAAILGGFIGFEREMHGQAAGLRTYILVCVGSTLLMMLSLHMEEMHRHLLVTDSVVRLDPARIASYAIASMGFLGAGAIIIGKGSVRGLTTAAGLWLVTAVGLAVGAGYLLPAFISTIISLFILYGARQIKSAALPREEHTILSLKYDSQARPLNLIKQILQEYQIAIQFVNYKSDLVNRTVTYNLRLLSNSDLPWGRITKRLSETPGLQELHWQEGEVP
jgi:putative Mg2+ transporter-C (MgtC) family protein|uniref:MgtC/SapB family protein n=1 Tax=Desulfobacca acetoxidans TaxID=60893 RepID=A0A7C3SJ44_9BACT